MNAELSSAEAICCTHYSDFSKKGFALKKGFANHHFYQDIQV